MVDTTVFVLHYSDDRIHPIMEENNLALNELLLRCVQSIKRNTKYPHKLIIVDNGSPEVGHEDAVNLLKEHGLSPEFLWVREDWHPVAVGANKAMDALETDYMAFITSDIKPGVDWLKCMIEPLKSDPWHMTAIEPLLGPYGIGDINLYRTPSFWKKLQLKEGQNKAERVANYWKVNGVPFELDEYEEPNPKCRLLMIKGNQRISIFSASRDFIDVVGRYDETFLRACEYQYFFQALKNGIENPTSTAAYTYFSHRGSIFRTGVGSYSSNDIKKYAPMGDLRYERGAHNVFEKKDDLCFRRTGKGSYEIFRNDTNQILYKDMDIRKVITKWEELAK